MNVSPSAVSKSLAKLRAWFDDPLFINPAGPGTTPLVSSMEQDLADADADEHGKSSINRTIPCPAASIRTGGKAPLLMILFNTLSQRIYQRYPEH